MRIIRLESEEDWRWLRNVIDRAHAKTWENPTYLYEDQLQIKTISEQINNAELVDGNASELDLTESVPTVKAPTKRRKRGSAAKTNVKALQYCEAHPHYTAQRSPRTDCQDCWDAYTKLNPTKAPTARRKFERTYK